MKKIIIVALLLLVITYLLLGSSILLSILTQVGDLYILVPVLVVTVGLVLAYTWHHFISIKLNKDSKDQQ